MTKLNEDDFLEKLMPYLRRGSEGGEDRCPDPESLVAFCEGTLYASRSEQIRDHFARCAACAAIHERLLRFESNFQPSQSQWLNAEKRLDNWMDSLLAAESLQAKENKKARERALTDALWIGGRSRGVIGGGKHALAPVLQLPQYRNGRTRAESTR